MTDTKQEGRGGRPKRTAPRERKGDPPKWLVDVEERTRGIRKVAENGLVLRSRAAPTLLHHYTDARGLQGILESGCIRASHGLYLNDRSELSYIDEVVAEVCASLRARARNSVALEVLEIAGRPGWRSSESTIEQVYLACFSRNSDQLSQWRAYSGDGLGYSITVATESFRLRPVPQASVVLVRVRYQRNEQILLVRMYATMVVDALNRCSQKMSRREHELVRFHGYAAMLDVASTLGVAIKNPGFEEEAEWRLVVVDPKESPMGSYVEYRPGPFGVTPYVNLEPVSGKLPIRQVTLGPRLHQGHARQATIGLLAKHGVETTFVQAPNFVPVIHSRTSYRGGGA